MLLLVNILGHVSRDTGPSVDVVIIMGAPVCMAWPLHGPLHRP